MTEKIPVIAQPEILSEFGLYFSLFVPLVCLVAAAVGLHLVVRLINRRYFRERRLVYEIVRYTSLSVLFTLVLLVLFFGLPYSDLNESQTALLGHVLRGLLILAFAYLTIKVLFAFSRVYLRRYDISLADNLKARKIHTQIRIIERLVAFAIIVVAVSLFLMSFEGVRRYGVSLLASAGVIGVVAGLAAQKSLAMVLAGIQIALTQPIRIDDAVIVENEWGWIEEITLTYVVVRLWDRRRLVVPINYFIERPFQNWTRNSADLIGSVYLYVDYRVPVDELRARVKEIARGCEFWNGEVCVLQVTEFLEHMVQLRVLVSGDNSPRTFDLRCYVREHLLHFLREHYPDSLPRVRLDASYQDAPADGPGSSGSSGSSGAPPAGPARPDEPSTLTD